MAFLDDVKGQLPSLSDQDKKSACEIILQSLSNGSHDELLKKRLEALTVERAEADKRIKAVLGGAGTATDENLRMAYKEYGDEMRHFSTVRSALTTFLVTVSLAAFSAYFNKSQSHPFLVAAALVFAAAAIAVCLEFSRRTSKAYLRRKRIWNHFAMRQLVSMLDDPGYPPRSLTLGVMLQDATNYFLLIGLGLIVAAFFYRDLLSTFLPALPL
jgi:hypothetical protein